MPVIAVAAGYGERMQWTTISEVASASPQVKRVDLGLTCDDVDQGDYEDDPLLEKYRNSCNEADKHNCPRGILLTQPPQSGHDALGAARLLNELAKNAN